MNDKMYAEFESWWYASKYCQVVNSSENAKQTAWDGWRASREALVIELPVCDPSYPPLTIPYVQACREAIEAAGLKTK